MRWLRICGFIFRLKDISCIFKSSSHYSPTIIIETNGNKTHTFNFDSIDDRDSKFETIGYALNILTDGVSGD